MKHAKFLLLMIAGEPLNWLLVSPLRLELTLRCHCTVLTFINHTSLEFINRGWHEKEGEKMLRDDFVDLLVT